MHIVLEGPAREPARYLFAMHDVEASEPLRVAVYGSPHFAAALERENADEAIRLQILKHDPDRTADGVDGIDVVLIAPDVQPGRAADLVHRHPRVHLVYAGTPEPSVACVALHKSGTNLMTALLRRLGYAVAGEGTGRSPYADGLWESHEEETLADLPARSAYFAHSLPLPDIGGIGQEPRPLFNLLCAQPWPIVFHYRDPRAVLASLCRYLARSAGDFTTAPFHVMVARILRELPAADRLDFAIANLEPYLRWSFSNNAWLLDVPFVMRSSYEELVGARGGGDQTDAVRWVAQLMLRLQVGGDPAEVASAIYDEGSRTFDRGSAYGWQAEFSASQRDLFNTRYADMLRRYGYAPA